MEQQNKKVSTFLLVLAFATVYIVWGSTYYFIQQALTGFPPFTLGAVRFLIAGVIMLVWCGIRREKILDFDLLPHAALGGVLMLFVGNGMVIWVEQTLPSAMAAIMVSSAPLWFVLLDKPKWSVNLRNPGIIFGLIMGFVGVVLLFGEKIVGDTVNINGRQEIIGLSLLNIGVVSWAAGSLYVKYKIKKASALVNTSWQIIAAGLAFVPGVFITGELKSFNWHAIPTFAWVSLWYLVFMGSIAAFSAYVWLLQVRPATQVSTYAYVNPVVAVLLGVSLAGEKITILPILGLTVILASVLIINIVNMRAGKSNS